MLHKNEQHGNCFERFKSYGILRDIPEFLNLQNHSCENLKFRKIFKLKVHQVFKRAYWKVKYP
jgi:hypothetical protein